MKSSITLVVCGRMLDHDTITVVAVPKDSVIENQTLWILICRTEKLSFLSDDGDGSMYPSCILQRLRLI